MIQDSAAVSVQYYGVVWRGWLGSRLRTKTWWRKSLKPSKTRHYVTIRPGMFQQGCNPHHGSEANANNTKMAATVGRGCGCKRQAWGRGAAGRALRAYNARFSQGCMVVLQRKKGRAKFRSLIYNTANVVLLFVLAQRLILLTHTRSKKSRYVPSLFGGTHAGLSGLTSLLLRKQP